MRKITQEESEKIVKESENLTVNLFSLYRNTRILWMKKVCKVYRKNRKNSGLTQVNWTNIALSKRR